MFATRNRNIAGQDTTVSASKPSLLTSYRREYDCVAVWAGFERFPAQSDIDGVEQTSYRHSELQVLSGSLSTKTSFNVAESTTNETSRSRCRKQLYERLWRIDQGLDIDPSEQSLFGVEAGHYADSAVDIESTTSYDLFKYGRTEACVQQLELPQPIQRRVLYLISNRSLKCFNRFGGLAAAIVGYSILSLAEHHNLSDVRDLEDEDEDNSWMSRIKELADHLGIIGATSRTYRRLIDYVQNLHEGGA